jgi:LysM repeat protein
MRRSIKQILAIFFCFELFSTAAVAQPAADPISCDEPYIVQPGDTLRAIAQRAYSTDGFDALYQVNQQTIGPNPNAIDVGMSLIVPCDLEQSQEQSQSQDQDQDQDQDQSQAQSQDQTQTQDVLGPDFSPALGTSATNQPGALAEIATGTEAVLVFNRAAAPNFILNVEIIDKYLAEITEITQGRVRFVDPPEVVQDPRVQLDLVLSGSVDGAYVFNGHLAESHPLLQLPMNPLMGGTAEQTAVALWRLHQEYLSNTDYLDGIRLLGFIGAPAAHVWRLKENSVSPGENIWASNEYTVPYFDGLDTRGASAVQEENAAWLSEFEEQRGEKLTLVMAHGAALAGGIWKDNNRVVTEIKNGVYTPTFSVVLSEAAWEKISPIDQAAIFSLSGESLSQRSAAWDSFDNGLRLRMLEQGLEAIEADMALLSEIQDQSRIGLEKWMAVADSNGISGYQAINDYLENLSTLEK